MKPTYRTCHGCESPTECRIKDQCNFAGIPMSHFGLESDALYARHRVSSSREFANGTGAAAPAPHVREVLEELLRDGELAARAARRRRPGTRIDDPSAADPWTDWVEESTDFFPHRPNVVERVISTVVMIFVGAYIGATEGWKR